MFNIITGSFLISFLHGIIPSHWLPVLSIGKKDGWSMVEITRVTLLAGLAHAASTICIGILLSLVSLELSRQIEQFARYFAPVLLVSLGIYFIYQHHRHHHFHLHTAPQPSLSKNRIISTLMIAMFLSPCLEIEAYFLMAGPKGWTAVLTIALIYLVISVTGMVIWVRIAYSGMMKLNWHSLEHKAGIITGWTLIITGLLSYFIY